MTVGPFLPRPPDGFLPSRWKTRLQSALALVLVLVLVVLTYWGSVLPAEDASDEPAQGGKGSFIERIRQRAAEDRAETAPADLSAALSALAAAPVEQTVTTHLRHVTAIVVPPPETLAEVVVGDSRQWEVSSTERMVFVRPLVEAARSNLVLLTAAGEIVPLLVVEDAAEAIDTVVRVETGTLVRRGVPAVHPVARIAAAAEGAGP